MIRTALFVPGHRPRAIEKARALEVDLLIFDLEDAVPEGEKATAREHVRTALARGPASTLVAVRINGVGGQLRADDLAALDGCPLDFLVLPKVEGPAELSELPPGPPLLAMIETPAGVLQAPMIARDPRVGGLIAGTNDLAANLRLPSSSGRAGLAFALQSIVLAARAAERIALDGVFNRLDDPDGLAAECREGRSFGFDGKTLIHPDQVAAAARAFAPSEAELADARALVAAARGGAERFRGRMVEAMHVAAAQRLLEGSPGGGKSGGPSL